MTEKEMSQKEKRKLKRAELLEEKKRGQFQYKNITNADLVLPAPLPSGVKMIPSQGLFTGNGLYRSMVPRTLRIMRIIESPNPKPAPEVKEELEDILPLGEDVKIEESLEVKVEITENSDEDESGERLELTKELLENLRIEKKMSWAKIAKETSYSVTFLRRKCKEYEIC